MAGRDEKPNILFLFPDQWRWDWLGIHGTVPVRTPHIDALARRGVRFTQCRTNSPLCAPARACLATGRRYERTGVIDNGQNTDAAHGLIFQRLRDAGYRVATCGKHDLHKGAQTSRNTGLSDALRAYGFTDAIDQGGKWDTRNRLRRDQPEAYGTYLHEHGLAQVYLDDMQRRDQVRTGEEHLLDVAAHGLERRHYIDDFCGRSAMTLLEDLPAGSPWMLWVNFPGPHEPFDPPSELRQRYDGIAFPGPINPNDAPNDHTQIRRNYAAMMEGIDEWVGRILARVAERGEADRTVVVFSSDHGEMLGDHGRWYKCCAYEGSVHVPLIVAGPGIAAGVERADLVELIDISATFADLAGIEPDEDWDARSFAPLLAAGDAPPHRRVQVSALKSWRMIVDGRWKLILDTQAPPTLFDLATDPHETVDVAAANRALVAQLTEQLGNESPATTRL